MVGVKWKLLHKQRAMVVVRVALGKSPFGAKDSRKPGTCVRKILAVDRRLRKQSTSGVCECPTYHLSLGAQLMWIPIVIDVNCNLRGIFDDGRTRWRDVGACRQRQSCPLRPGFPT